jgi:intracellular sulfur oxidation DsrE/DsrF family protein
MKVYKIVSVVFGLSAMMLCSIPSYAGNPHSKGNTECPVDLLPGGAPLDEEFGQGTADLTHCLKKRHALKVAVEINRRCRDWSTIGNTNCPGNGIGTPDALGNMTNVLNDYDYTNGMKPGQDYTMIAIVHGSGGYLLLDDTARNPYREQITDLMKRGVKFYFCQNTVRGFIRSGVLETPNTPPHYYTSVAEQLIPGVELVTAGFSAVADVQQQGWSVITP